MANQDFYDGKLDNFRVWARQITDTERTYLYDEYVPPPEPELPTDLLDYWYDAADAATISGTPDNYTVENKGLASSPLLGQASPLRYGVVTLNGLPLFSIDTSQFLPNNPNRAWRFSIDAGKVVDSSSTVYLAGTWSNNFLRAFVTRDLSGLNSEVFTDPGYRIYSGGTYQDFSSGWMVGSICVIKNNRVWVNDVLRCEISGVNLPSTGDSGSCDALLCPSSNGSAAHDDGVGEICVYNDPTLDPAVGGDKHDLIMSYLAEKWGIALP